MSSTLEIKTQEVESSTGKKLLTHEETAKYLGVDKESINELIQSRHIKTVGMFIKSVELAKFELDTEVENLHIIPSEPIDTNAKFVYPPTHFGTEEYVVSEEEYKMGQALGGSVFYNSTRQAWQAAFYVQEGGVKKRKIITGANEHDTRNRMEVIQSLYIPVVAQNVLAVPPMSVCKNTLYQSMRKKY